ncbi:ABC transporter ATP-binding protein, partial [Candidatus Pelagibacter sp.]|nr:ABC transporter ATP-binding protein [Candidatus Pelagibacter sp.]
ITAMILPLIIFLYFEKNINELIPIFALFLVGLFKIIPTFNRLVQGYQILKFNKPSLEIIYQQFFDLKKNEKVENTNLVFEKSLKFVNLDFSYKKNNHQVFKKLDLEIKKNESVAIIGKNGSGKSTLLNLLTGLIKPTSGNILIDNKIKLTEFDNNWLKHLSYVQQNIFLLDDTIKNNITFENDKGLNTSNYEYVKKFIDLDVIFRNLSKGLDTMVGNDGLNLSGGQKQLVSIARALYKNSNVLVFDEANSALDTVYKENLKKILNKLKGTKTIIFVTHDLSFLENSFDKVYLIESGKINLQ